MKVRPGLLNTTLLKWLFLPQLSCSEISPAPNEEGFFLVTVNPMHISVLVLRLGDAELSPTFPNNSSSWMLGWEIPPEMVNDYNISPDCINPLISLVLEKTQQLIF